MNAIQNINFYRILSVLNLMNAIMVNLTILYFYILLIKLVAVYKAISGIINECADVCPGNCKLLLY